MPFGGKSSSKISLKNCNIHSFPNEQVHGDEMQYELNVKATYKYFKNLINHFLISFTWECRIILGLADKL